MLSTQLKEATKTAHQELEKTVVQKLKAIRSNADYAGLLKHFYAYFHALEQAIAPYISTALLPDLAARRNSSDLKKDIEELGASTEALPDVQVPEISNTLEALAAMYVMEGSVMGGPIIVQMLSKYGVTQGVSFFSGYGAATGEMWARFVGVLNAQASSESDEARAIDAANETFSRFGSVFREVERIDHY